MMIARTNTTGLLREALTPEQVDLFRRDGGEPQITKKEADGEHPASHYLVVGDANAPGTWRLRVRDANGRPDHRLMGAAWAALHAGFRGQRYDGPQKQQAIARLRKLYESEDLSTPAVTAGEQPTAPQFVASLAATAETGTVRIPLAVTGTWVRGEQQFSITRKDLDAIERNFKARRNGEINVDYDHASEMPEVAAGGPIPSAGRIVAIDAPESAGAAQDSKSARFILWGWYEPTATARQMIQRQEYRYISPAIDWGARSKRTGRSQGATLTSVALTNRPFLEELPQIHLSDPSFKLIEAASGLRVQLSNSETGGERPPQQQGGSMKKVQVSAAPGDAAAGADGKIMIGHPDFEDEYFADPDEVRQALQDMGLAAPEADGNAQDADGDGDNDAGTGQLREIPLAEAAAVLSESQARGKAVPAGEFFRARVEQAVDDAVKAGKILPRQRQDWRRIALADFTTFSRLMGEQPTRLPLKPLGFSGAAPVDVPTQVKFLAEQRMRERGMSFGQALSEIGREQPALMQEYRKAVSGN